MHIVITVCAVLCYAACLTGLARVYGCHSKELTLGKHIRMNWPGRGFLMLCLSLVVRELNKVEVRGSSSAN
jgi:hypothetical protein